MSPTENRATEIHIMGYIWQYTRYIFKNRRFYHFPQHLVHSPTSMFPKFWINSRSQLLHKEHERVGRLFDVGNAISYHLMLFLIFISGGQKWFKNEKWPHFIHVNVGIFSSYTYSFTGIAGIFVWKAVEGFKSKSPPGCREITQTDIKDLNIV